MLRGCLWMLFRIFGAVNAFQSPSLMELGFPEILLPLTEASVLQTYPTILFLLSFRDFQAILSGDPFRRRLRWLSNSGRRSCDREGY